MKLPKEQMEHDYKFVCLFWEFWKKYGKPEAGEDYWESVVQDMSEIINEQSEFVNNIGQVILAELERRYRHE